MPLTANARTAIARTLKQKRSEVAGKLQDLLNNQDATLADIELPQDADPAEPPVERLRRFMRLLAEVDGRLGRGGADFGRCAKCHAEIGETSLVEVPWADRCRECGS